MPTHDARGRIKEALQQAFDQRRLTPAELAGRAGVSERTVRRFFAGRTCSLDTAAAIARVLRVDMDSSWPGMRQDAAGSDKARQSAPELSPIVGWKRAATVLGLSRRTIERTRRAAGDRHRAWWPSRDALLKWFAGLLVGEV